MTIKWQTNDKKWQGHDKEITKNDNTNPKWQTQMQKKCNKNAKKWQHNYFGISNVCRPKIFLMPVRSYWLVYQLCCLKACTTHLEWNLLQNWPIALKTCSHVRTIPFSCVLVVVGFDHCVPLHPHCITVTYVRDFSETWWHDSTWFDMMKSVVLQSVPWIPGCHDRLLMQCAPCGGQMMCHHGRQRYQCKDCGGGRICEHEKRRDACNLGRVSRMIDSFVFCRCWAVVAPMMHGNHLGFCWIWSMILRYSEYFWWGQNCAISGAKTWHWRVGVPGWITPSCLAR